jgi:hypothetical protein
MAQNLAGPQDNAENTTAAADRRVWTRAESSRPIPRRIYRVDTLEPLDAWIVDLSQGGLALLLPQPLPDGTLLFIELESAPQVQPVKAWANVVRSTRTDDGSWQVGCEFVNRLSEKDLASLLS